MPNSQTQNHRRDMNWEISTKAKKEKEIDTKNFTFVFSPIDVRTRNLQWLLNRFGAKKTHKYIYKYKSRLLIKMANDTDDC